MNKISIALSCVLGLMAAAVADDEPKVDRKPFHIGALHEFGQLGKGIFKVGTQGNAETLELEWIDHFGAFLTQEAVINDRLALSAGLGGVFQYRKPERVQPDFYGTQRGEFFIGPTKADAVYSFGDIENPWLRVGTGMYGYKYNPQAYDLGEYLFRTLPYPTVINTGGYVLVGSAAANLEGFKAHLSLGDFKADAFFITETGLAPLYDWSLAALASYSVADGLLEIGAGVNFKRLIQVNPSRTARELKQNGYFEYGGKAYTTGIDYYSRAEDWYLTHGDSVTAATYAADRAVVVDTVAARRAANLPVPDTSYYTAAGTLLMGRFTFDPKKLFDGGIFGPEDLKLYGEVALLGVKDYPVFYTKKSERMPMMIGFNLPGFNLLDLIAVQVEQFKSPFLNNTAQVAKRGINIPHFPISSDSLLSKDAYNDMATKDDFKWSVLIQKKIGRHITISGQAANDHLKLVSSRYFYGPQFDHNEVTVSKDHWYWMMQVGWGI